MEARKVLLPLVVCVFALMLSIHLVQAGNARVATLHTTDDYGVDKIEFGLGETVHVRWTADGTVDIEVKFEDGSTDGGPWINLPRAGEISFSPSKGSGYYRMYCTGAQTITVAYGTIFVAPEFPLGAIVATIASFGALGVFGTLKLRQARTKRIRT